LQSAEEVELRKSYRIRRLTISSDYVVYLKSLIFDVRPKDDPKLLSQAMSGGNSTLWYSSLFWSRATSNGCENNFPKWGS
jgi:hypothetical protein